ncbi:MAG: GH3 auxin-responsive promoter family protein [Oscillibacter sp.]|jgi:hypothetical protein|nr:GH3 auxin-responsive promoter family protein [Oscillibacter sp.]
MRFEEQTKRTPREQLWREYCGFLDMSLADYMYTQRRLMEEQIRLWTASGLGRSLLGDKQPHTIDELRALLPLTTYEDYADALLAKRSDLLCSEPAVWIQTTWEGGLRPVKLAPYTRPMLDTYCHNLVASLMMATATKKGTYNFKSGDRVLYGGAPLPYATGLLPSIANEQVKFVWLPDDNAADGLSFSQRIKKGFAMGMNGGIDFFFGIGSVANYITDSFGRITEHSGGSRKKLSVSPKYAFRFLQAKYISRRDDRPVQPKDIFHLKAMFYAGTDARCYRDRLTEAWGVVPTELAAGTEFTCIGAETWEHNGMPFFPDACFYEFIPQEEMRRSRKDRAYTPRTCLMDEVRSGETYELVISVLHGGAFMRYRVGDTYHCVSAGNGAIPRFNYVDRTPDVIDIAGFTRITESSVQEVLRLSKLGIGEWLMKKEYDEHGSPFLHMYAEITPEAQEHDVTVRQVLQEHMAVYFKFFDSDYADLKKLLNMDPLQITILKYGTIQAYQAATDQVLPRINPGMLDVTALLRWQTHPGREAAGV